MRKTLMFQTKGEGENKRCGKSARNDDDASFLSLLIILIHVRLHLLFSHLYHKWHLVIETETVCPLRGERTGLSFRFHFSSQSGLHHIMFKCSSYENSVGDSVRFVMRRTLFCPPLPDSRSWRQAAYCDEHTWNHPLVQDIAWGSERLPAELIHFYVLKLWPPSFAVFSHLKS